SKFNGQSTDPCEAKLATCSLRGHLTQHSPHYSKMAGSHLQCPPRLFERNQTVISSVTGRDCVCLSVCPAMAWRPVQGVSCLSPDDSWDRLQHPPATLTEKRLRKWMDGWMAPDITIHLSRGRIKIVILMFSESIRE
ncbi:hypothetical protein MHYP_G00191080, partial [Metynnis hypsauchen]